MRRTIRFSGQTHQLWVAGAALAVLSAAANIASPLYPTCQQLHGMSDLMMTALYATFAAAALPALMLFGSAADALGRRPVLLAGLAAAAAGTTLFALDIIGVAGLFLGRVLVGVGLGLGTGAGIALMTETSGPTRPGRGATLGTIAFVLGTGAGPAMAGIVADVTGSTIVPFLVMLAGLGAVACALALLRVGRPPLTQRWRPSWPRVPARMRAPFAISATTGFLGWSAVGVFLALLPSVAASVLGTQSLAVPGAVIGAVLLCSAASQIFAARCRPRTAQTMGLSALAAGLGLLLGAHLPLFEQTGALLMIAAAAVLTGVGHGLSYWGANRETDALTPPQQQAGVAAALYLAFYAGAGLPALAVGAISLTTSFTAAVLIVTLILMLVTIAFQPAPGLHPKPQRPTAASTNTSEMSVEVTRKQDAAAEQSG